MYELASNKILVGHILAKIWFIYEYNDSIIQNPYPCAFSRWTADSDALSVQLGLITRHVH